VLRLVLVDWKMSLLCWKACGLSLNTLTLTLTLFLLFLLFAWSSLWMLPLLLGYKTLDFILAFQELGINFEHIKRKV